MHCLENDDPEVPVTSSTKGLGRTSPSSEIAGDQRLVRRPAVFFDRDGVLNRDVAYLHQPDEFEWLEGAKTAIRLCNDADYFVFVVTNQAGVARGYYDESDVENLHAWIRVELELQGARVDAFEYCPHHPDGIRPEYRKTCRRRKPAPGMILDLLADWPVDKE